ncbi:sensor histidine kinase [Niabella beijingensis]|uniref:sensor histidine kinase n=1 Tax=Niabella beijingensis TaxID=2872700 RepID=UPI001CBDF86F|nr:ATP-binding protein [Niabella beijingensis]MBZ4191316.1 GAF domain-containing protein [Niabella beijingensis]
MTPSLPATEIAPDKRLQRLVDAVQELSLARNLETVTRIVRSAARELTGADGATFVLRDKDKCFYVDEDAISPLWKGSRFPIETCVSGWSMLNKQAVIIPDIYQDDRIPAEAYRPTFVKSLVMVPIRTMDPIGAIGNYWAHTHHATLEEAQLLQSLADITAVTMENVQIYAELEERVKLRTAELEVANKQLEAFAYSVSHDLRSPLAGIQGLAGILQEEYRDRLDGEGQELTDLILQCVKNMTHLIDNLLVFFTTSQKELRPGDTSMKEMAEEYFDALRKQEPEGRVFEFSVDELPNAGVDATLMKHVWINLLSNAIKYSRKKDKTVIRVGFEETPQQTTYFVQDEGSGFDMMYYNKLFGAFQRLHSDQEFEGNGIGLSLVERIISRYGGKVWATAADGAGATFYFSLPRETVR